MLTILMGRAKTGKSEQVLRRIGELGDSSRQILLVPEHASHQAEVDLCRACGDTASRHAEVLSFRRLCDRVLTITGGAAQVTLDAGGKLLTLQKALGEVAPLLKVYRRPSQKASFLQQLLDLFDELRCYDVSPELLESQAREIQGATRDKLLDLSLLYGAYESRLYRPGLDARDRMTKLCEALESSRYAFGKDVFVDGFTYFNAQERQVLESILRQARSVTGGAGQRGGDVSGLSPHPGPADAAGGPGGLPMGGPDAHQRRRLRPGIFGASLLRRGGALPRRQLRHPCPGGGHRFFRGGADGSGHPPPGSGGEVPLPGYHRGRPEHDRLRGHH